MSDPQTAESAIAPRVRYVPGRALPILIAACLPLYVFGSFGMASALLASAFFLLLAWLQARALARELPSVRRRLEPRLLVGVANPVELQLKSRGAHRLRVSIRDDYPSGFVAQPAELACVLDPGDRAVLRYDLSSERRGTFRFESIHLRLERDGFFGFALGSAIASFDAGERVRVYPNLRGPRRYELAARLGALAQLGVRSVPRPGGGGEFEELRDYVAGDSFRDVDWKATAKRRRAITRVYGKEQNQQLILALDAGRMMATALDHLQKLDHAIHAALLLAHVALRNGDRVGLIVFADDVSAYVPPRTGQTQYRRILEALAGVEAGSSYVDFRRLAEFVRTKVPRRSLLFVFSDLLDEAQALPLTKQAPVLLRKHLVLCATMNEPAIEGAARAHAADSEQAYRRAAAVLVLDDRHAQKLLIQRSGVGVIEVEASALALATVNRYLALKAQHRL